MATDDIEWLAKHLKVIKVKPGKVIVVGTIDVEGLSANPSLRELIDLRDQVSKPSGPSVTLEVRV